MIDSIKTEPAVCIGKYKSTPIWGAEGKNAREGNL
jgi:hypothetical protein